MLLDRDVPATVEMVNALLALGFAAKLKPLEDTDKQSFTARVVGLLPGIERVGPYVITDYIDLVCSEADAGGSGPCTASASPSKSTSVGHMQRTIIGPGYSSTSSRFTNMGLPR